MEGDSRVGETLACAFIESLFLLLPEGLGAVIGGFVSSGVWGVTGVDVDGVVGEGDEATEGVGVMCTSSLALPCLVLLLPNEKISRQLFVSCEVVVGVDGVSEVWRCDCSCSCCRLKEEEEEEEGEDDDENNGGASDDANEDDNEEEGLRCARTMKRTRTKHVKGLRAKETIPRANENRSVFDP